MAESYTRLVQTLSDLLGADNVRAHEPVARYTTWRVGGPAAALCVVHDARALAPTVELVRDTSLPWLVLGRGSNVLVDDAGLDGVVIVNRAAGLAIDQAEGGRWKAEVDAGDQLPSSDSRLPTADVGVAVHAESGVLLSVLARQTAAHGLVGLAWGPDLP